MEARGYDDAPTQTKNAEKPVSESEEDRYGGIKKAWRYGDEESGYGSVPSNSRKEEAIRLKTLLDAKERNWNEDFQRLLEKPSQTPHDIKTKNQEIKKLYQEFIETATPIVKIIVDELKDPKTIQPQRIGGIAGGSKYIVKNILFKVALDDHKIYDGHHFAAKAAAHEFKSFEVLLQLQVPKLHFPLVGFVTYKGHSVVMSSILPITSKTLVMGSSDGGATIHNSDTEFDNIARDIAGKLNLKKHKVNNQELWLAADVEGHFGVDGRYYLLDTARLFPPEPAEEKRKGSTFYRLLRPELVSDKKRILTPLSSDAFSNFGILDREVHNAEVSSAKEILHTQTIPEVAAKLSKLEGKAINLVNILEIIHSAGINFRHLAKVVAALKSAPDAVKTLLVVDIVARAVNAQLKQEMYSDATKAKDVYVSHTSNFPSHLNQYYSALTDNFGNHISKSEVETILTKEKEHLILRLRELIGVNDKNEFQTVFKFPKLTPFLDTLKMQQEGRLDDAEKMYLHELEIKEVKCKSNPLLLVPVLKDLMILYKMWGRVKYQKADQSIRRVLKIQRETLGENHLDCASTIMDICALHGYFGDYSSDDEEMRKKAVEIRTEMLGLNHPDTAEAIYWLGGLYYATRKYAEAEPKFVQSIEIYEKTIGAHPKTADAINEFARLYYDQAMYEKAEPLFKRAVEMREEVLGPTHPMTAQAVSNLGAVNQVLKRYDEAERLYKRAVEIKEEAMGPNHPETASTINNIGLLLENRGKVEESLKYYQRAYDIYVQAFGEGAWYTTDTGKHLNRVKKNLGIN